MPKPNKEQNTKENQNKQKPGICKKKLSVHKIDPVLPMYIIFFSTDK